MPSRSKIWGGGHIVLSCHSSLLLCKSFLIFNLSNTFQPWVLWYVTWVFLVTWPFRWYRHFANYDLDFDLLLLKHNLGINFCTMRARALVHAIHVFLKTFPWVPSLVTMWPFTLVFLVRRPPRGYQHFKPCYLDLQLGVWSIFESLTLLITFE